MNCEAFGLFEDPVGAWARMGIWNGALVECRLGARWASVRAAVGSDGSDGSVARNDARGNDRVFREGGLFLRRKTGPRRRPPAPPKVASR